MKHLNFAFFKELGYNPTLTTIRLLAKTNIRTLFSFPKSIWYSMRYNMGEKFLLHNPYIYPYRYNADTQGEEAHQPLNLARKLDKKVEEKFIHSYALKTGSTWAKFVSKDQGKIIEEFNEIMNEVLSVLKYNDVKTLDFPVFVSTRILLAIATHENNESLDVNEEGLGKLQEMISAKLDLADAESLAYLVYSLKKLNINNKDLLQRALDELSNKYFEFEFTLVNHKSPFYFRYEEVKKENIGSKALNNLGNKLFFQGLI